MLLFVVAMREEIQDILNQPTCQLVKKNNYYKCYVFKKSFILITGVGKLNAGISLYSFLNDFKEMNISMIINIGIVGINTKNLCELPKLFIVNRSYFSDVNLTFFAYKIGQMPKMQPYFQCKDITNRFKEQVEKINCLTSDTFISNEQQLHS